MDFEEKTKALNKEFGEMQDLISRSQVVISESTRRQFQIQGELKIIEEIKNEVKPKE